VFVWPEVSIEGQGVVVTSIQKEKNSPSDSGTQGKNLVVLKKKRKKKLYIYIYKIFLYIYIYKIYYFPTALLIAQAPRGHPVLSPSVSRAGFTIHGAVCALRGWRQFQLVTYVPAAEHYSIPASLAQPAGLRVEEVGEVNSVSNPAQVLPKQQPRKTRLLWLCFFFSLKPNKDFIVHAQTI